MSENDDGCKKIKNKNLLSKKTSTGLRVDGSRRKIKTADDGPAIREEEKRVCENTPKATADSSELNNLELVDACGVESLEDRENENLLQADSFKVSFEFTHIRQNPDHQSKTEYVLKQVEENFEEEIQVGSRDERPLEADTPDSRSMPKRNGTEDTHQAISNRIGHGDVTFGLWSDVKGRDAAKDNPDIVGPSPTPSSTYDQPVLSDASFGFSTPSDDRENKKQSSSNRPSDKMSSNSQSTLEEILKLLNEEEDEETKSARTQEETIENLLALLANEDPSLGLERSQHISALKSFLSGQCSCPLCKSFLRMKKRRKKSDKLKKWTRFFLDEKSTSGTSGPSLIVKSMMMILKESFQQPGLRPDMVANLRDLVAKEGLVAHDVYPDGNCLFAAVVDQLRIRGDFRYTARTLRKTAVDYLTSHPRQEDGTHLKEFLNKETWSAYLSRMAKDGQWGDHIILGAIVEIVESPIVILGGISGLNRTALFPRKSQDKAVSNGNYDCDSAEDIPDSVVDGLHLGHFAELHYVSLRPTDWEDRLHKELRRQEKDQLQILPFRNHHLNFFIKYIRNCGIITYSGESKLKIGTEDVGRGVVEKKNITDHVLGSVSDHTLPVFSCFKSCLPDNAVLFQKQENEKKEDMTVTTQIITSPKDTVVVNKDFKGVRKPVDLVMETNNSPTGYLRLLPVSSEVWKSALLEEGTHVCFIRHLNLHKADYFLTVLDFSTWSPVIEIGFKCHWPNIASEWPLRERPSGWPNPHTVKDVVENHCRVVPRASEETTHPNTEWQFSFAIAEHILFKENLSHFQKSCFHMFKLLVEHQVKDTEIVLHQCLKHIFFYACEELAFEMWKRRPAVCISRLIEMFYEQVSSGVLPNYFIKDRNMIEFCSGEDLHQVTGQLVLLTRSPLVSLYFLLDSKGYMISHIGTMSDSLFENAQRFLEHKNFPKSMIELVTNEAAQLIQANLMKEEYDLGNDLFEDMYEDIEELHADQGDVLLPSLFRKVTTEIEIKTRWCFAFLLSEKYGTSLIDVTMKGQPSAQLSDVFGEEFLQYIRCGNVPVPKTCTENNLVAHFITEIIKVIKLMKREMALLYGLKHFLTKYDEFVKDVASSQKEQLPHSQTDLAAYVQNTFSYNPLLVIYMEFATLCQTFSQLKMLADHMETFEALALKSSYEPYRMIVACYWGMLGHKDRGDQLHQSRHTSSSTSSIIQQTLGLLQPQGQTQSQGDFDPFEFNF